MRRKKETLIKISFRINEFHLKYLNRLVQAGHYESISEAIRDAIDRLLEKYITAIIR